MEDTHWVAKRDEYLKLIVSLNPCFNGRYSLSPDDCDLRQYFAVLILVLMEDTHWDKQARVFKLKDGVLILVLMEDTHWVVR